MPAAVHAGAGVEEEDAMKFFKKTGPTKLDGKLIYPALFGGVVIAPFARLADGSLAGAAVVLFALVAWIACVIAWLRRPA